MSDATATYVDPPILNEVIPVALLSSSDPPSVICDTGSMVIVCAKVSSKVILKVEIAITVTNTHTHKMGGI